MKKNDEIILNISDYTADGSGIGKYEGMAIFVPLTAVGDTVRAKILKVKKTYAFGKLMEILEKSNCRTDNDCSAFSRCGGCAFRHIEYKAELKAKENRVYETIKRIGGVDLKPQPILYDSPFRYRNKAQFPVSIDGKLGFFATHSHRIIPCGDCLLQPEVFNLIAKITTDWISKFNISIYNSEAKSGLLRHIYTRIGTRTGEIMVCAVINGSSLPFADEWISALKNAIGKNLKSVQLNINTADTNVILGEKCVTLLGEDYITDILCDIKIRLSPLSFYQVNPAMAEKLYERAKDYAQPDGKTILDLYCGAGTIGLSMANKAKKVIGVEIVPKAINDAKFNAENNGIENAEFLCMDATAAGEKFSSEGFSPDVVILDPPRKGCTEELINTVTRKFAPERVVYVSCDVGTLARDIKIFTKLGYTLKEYTPADLFPRTGHVETVVLMSRAR